MIFLDNASTTKMYPEVIQEINRVNEGLFYNPSALYYKSTEITTELNEIKTSFLNMLYASSFDNFIFTSGATESNNLALRGVLKKNGKLLISSAEHPSVYNLAKQLQQEGYTVDYIKVTENGIVDEDDLMKKLQDTTVVSFIHVCNETGAINNIKHLAALVKNYNSNIIVHSDGVQAFGKINVNLSDLGVDLYTISAHKIHGPKGVGGLFIKKGINLKPLLFGGEHQNGLRPGTYNTAGIFAFNIAALKTIEKMEQNYSYVNSLKEVLFALLKNELPEVKIISKEDNYSPYIAALYIPKINSETTLHLLEEFDIFVGNGSACSGKHSENRILKEMGFNNEIIKSSIRISFDFTNTEDEIKFFVEKLKLIMIRQHKTIK